LCSLRRSFLHFQCFYSWQKVVFLHAYLYWIIKMGITELILNYNLIVIKAQGKGIGNESYSWYNSNLLHEKNDHNLSTKFKFKVIAITSTGKG